MICKENHFNWIIFQPIMNELPDMLWLENLLNLSSVLSEGGRRFFIFYLGTVKFYRNVNHMYINHFTPNCIWLGCTFQQQVKVNALLS